MIKLANLNGNKTIIIVFRVLQDRYFISNARPWPDKSLGNWSFEKNKLQGVASAS